MNIENITREQVMEFLPDAIKTALNSYQDFMQRTIKQDIAKEFSEHHTACKAAIAHIELLLKLARWAQAEPTEDPETSSTPSSAKEEYERFLEKESGIGHHAYIRNNL